MKPEELKASLTGVIVMMMTPFDEHLDLHEDAVAANLRVLIDSGIRTGSGAVVVAGSIGECYAMTNAERMRLAEAAVQAAAGDVPVIVGCNHSATAPAIELARHAETIGADGIMLLPPVYATPPERRIYEWYRAIAAETSLGIMAYNNPLMVPVDMSVDLLKRIADDVPSVVALKECSENICRLDDGYHVLRPRLAIINGNCEEDEPCATLRGAAGFSSYLANFAPKVVLHLSRAGRQGDWQRAWEIHWQLMRFINFMHEMRGDAKCLVKIAQDLVGLSGGPVRPPSLPATPEDRAGVETLLREADLIN